MIYFGPSGNSENFFNAGFKTSEQSAVWVREKGLNAFEYSFGRGILMGEAKAISLCNAFSENRVAISVHAPYFINFANPDAEKIQNSINYVINSAKMVKIMGGTRTVFHPASQGKETREVAFLRTKENFLKLTEAVYANGMENLTYCPETMGKLGQIGTIEEITELCAIDKIYIPTVDFGHVNAREQGSLKTVSDYQSRLEYMIKKLGYERMKNFHVHFSKIQYSQKGEVRHLNFDDQKYGPEFEPLAESLINLKLEPVIICESAGKQDEDAIYMKNVYYRLLENHD